jgi:hypothetical protein
MTRQTLDVTQQTDLDRRAAHVAILAALACNEDSRAVKTEPITDFRLNSDALQMEREVLAERLAGLSKPIWIEAVLRNSGLHVQTGPLSERPDLQVHYDRWHEMMASSKSPDRPPPDDATVLFWTEDQGLRARWRDFIRYQRDYIPTGPFSYGTSDVPGKWPVPKELAPSELEGVSRTIRIMRPGPVLMIDDRDV